MTLSEEEKRVINTSYLLHHGHFSQDIAKAVYLSSLTQMKENYNSKTETTEVVIPFIGKITIKYNYDDEVVDETDNKLKAEANVSCTIEPSRELKRCIGDLVDGNITNIEKKIYRDIESNLKKIINKEK